MVALVFAAAATLSFAQSLLVAGWLGPEEFGRYAVGLSIAAVTALIGFEWIRLAVIRFGQPGRPAPLDELLRGRTRGTGMALSALVLLAALCDRTLLLSASLASGLGLGLYEFAAAVARTAPTSRPYARVVLTRALAGLAGSVLAAGLLGSATAVLCAGMLASVAAAGPALGGAHRFRARSAADRAALAICLRYAGPVVSASAAFQAIPLLDRALLGARAGFAEAGVFGLAGELAMRLFQNVGAALDAALFRQAVEREREDGAEEGRRLTGRNLALLVAVLAPACTGLVAVWPSFAALFIPPAFQERVAPVAALAIPAFALYAVAQYGLAPLFQLGRGTPPVAVAAAVGLAVNVTLAATMPRPDAVAIAAAQAAGYGASALVLLGWARLRAFPVPWRDLLNACLSAVAMAALLWPWRTASPAPLVLPVQVGAGLLAYAAFAVMTDLAGCRAFLKGRRPPVTPR